LVYVSTDVPTTTLQGASVTVPRDPFETALVERARMGDHDAFATLLDARLPSTFRTALAILGNESDARDATQAIFVLAWRNLPQLRDPATFPAWFGRIVVNTARSSMRGRRRRTVREISVGVLPEEGAALASGEAGHEDRTVANDRLERALDRLAPAERTVLWLHHYEGLSLADVGTRMGVSAKTVKSRLFTARRALERALQAEDR
jgi:RNA polymerase sigma-70 factor (ECF subfamily)